MFPGMFEALAHAAGYKVSAIGLAPCRSLHTTFNRNGGEPQFGNHTRLSGLFIALCFGHRDVFAVGDQGVGGLARFDEGATQQVPVKSMRPDPILFGTTIAITYWG